MPTSWISLFTLSNFTTYYRMRKVFRLIVLFLLMISLALSLLPPTKGLAKPRADTIVTANNTVELITRINEANASGDK